MEIMGVRRVQQVVSGLAEVEILQIHQHDQLFSEVAASRVFVNFTEENRISAYTATNAAMFKSIQISETKILLTATECFGTQRSEGHKNSTRLQLLYAYEQSDHKPVYASFYVNTRLPYLTPSRFGNVCGCGKLKLVVCELSFVSSVEELDADDGAAFNIDGNISDGPALRRV